MEVTAVGGTLSDEQREAGCRILDYWRRYRERDLFHILKTAIRDAEHSLSGDVLRYLSPAEAALLNDPAMKARIRFRLAGESFPPDVVFKVYVRPGKQGAIHVFSGLEKIKPGTQAAEDALKQMGARKFLTQMRDDTEAECAIGMHSEEEGMTIKHYMRYRSFREERKADAGGTANTWRWLSVDEFLRSSHHILAGAGRDYSGQAVTHAVHTVHNIKSKSGRSLSRVAICDALERLAPPFRQNRKQGASPDAQPRKQKPRMLPSQIAKQRKIEKLRKLYNMATNSPSSNLVDEMVRLESPTGMSDEEADMEDDDHATPGMQGDGQARKKYEPLYVWSDTLLSDDLEEYY